MVAMAAVHLLYGSALLAEPLYVRDVLHRSPTTFAALQTVFGVWLVVAGIVVARLEDRLATLGPWPSAWRRPVWLPSSTSPRRPWWWRSSA